MPMNLKYNQEPGYSTIYKRFKSMSVKNSNG